MHAEPQQQHRWLQKLVGEWTYESECMMGPGQPAVKSSGRETVRSIGGLWVVGESTGQMPDGKPATMLITLGFDPRTERYVGTWVGSMMTHLWVYDGELDMAGKVLSLMAEGPGCDPASKTLHKFKDVIEIVDDDHRIFSGHMLGEDGQWQRFMTAKYTRTK